MDYRPVETTRKAPFEPVDPDFLEKIKGLLGYIGTINYFSYKDEIEDVKGVLSSITSVEYEDFVVVDDKVAVRIDRIITLFGKPGPSFEKYNRFSDVCFSCNDEGQF